MEDGYYWIWADDGYPPEVARKCGTFWVFIGWDMQDTHKNVMAEYPHHQPIPLPSLYNKGTTPSGGVSDIKGSDPLDPQPELWSLVPADVS